MLNAIKSMVNHVSMPVIVDPLISYLTAYDDGYAQDGLLHMSQLHYLCPRAQILSGLSGVWSKPSAMLQAKFDIGHAMHYHYQNKYLGPMGILHGDWRCLRCGAIVSGEMPDSEGCGNSDHVWEYVETVCRIPEYGIIGKCDGIIDRGDGEPWVVDFKTQDPYLFHNCTGASEAHKMQVNLYMYALGISRGIVLYIDKSANDRKVPCKEFIVERDDTLLNAAFEKAKLYWDCVSNQEIPDCGRPDKYKSKCGCRSFKDVDAIAATWKITPSLLPHFSEYNKDNNDG